MLEIKNVTVDDKPQQNIQDDLKTQIFSVLQAIPVVHLLTG